MFSGIVEEIGAVAAIDRGRSLTLSCDRVLVGTRIGDSIATDGVCLTVTALGPTWFHADVQPVTLRHTTLGSLRPGDPVNLERSLALGDRIGGHYVQGHIDDVGRVVGRSADGPAQVVRIAVPDHLRRHVVGKGYVAVDGASLTVVRVHPDGFEVSLVDHTQRSITLPRRRTGDMVNVEVDVMAKYAEQLSGSRPEAADTGLDDRAARGDHGKWVSADGLRRAGFG